MPTMLTALLVQPLPWNGTQWEASPGLCRFLTGRTWLHVRAHTGHEPFLLFLSKCYHKNKDEKPPAPDERVSANCSGAVSGFRGSCAPGHPETGTYLLHSEVVGIHEWHIKVQVSLKGSCKRVTCKRWTVSGNLPLLQVMHTRPNSTATKAAALCWFKELTRRPSICTFARTGVADKGLFSCLSSALLL